MNITLTTWFIAFGIWVWHSAGSTFGIEYFAAYLVEKSLR